jgi:hypothetical protein
MRNKEKILDRIIDLLNGAWMYNLSPTTQLFSSKDKTRLMLWNFFILFIYHGYQTDLYVTFQFGFESLIKTLPSLD